jgi:molybdate transport system permease protein
LDADTSSARPRVCPAQPIDMTLDVEIQKKLADFTLEVRFHADHAPLGILGASGAGKTMLLRSIAGLERPDRGRITLNGRALFDSERQVEAPARERRVGILFQSYALLPHRTVAENVGFGLGRLGRIERESKVKELVERTHLAGLEQRYPGELSGGEQQRTALARALSIEPEALLLDEPLAALDTHLRSQMEAQLQQTFASYRRPTLLVTHNIEEAYRLGERLLVLSRGRVVAFGEKGEVFRHPPSVEVARLTGCKNFSRARAISSDVVEAVDWGCRLRLAAAPAIAPTSVGIRAHYIEFLESAPGGGATENVFPCWLTRASETPFRVTLYLRLHQPPRDAEDFHVQAEAFKEKWQRFRDRPLPWHVRFSPDSVMALPE